MERGVISVRVIKKGNQFSRAVIKAGESSITAPVAAPIPVLAGDGEAVAEGGGVRR
jgi:hypothetical protein